jgi:hypothetical protein
VRTPDCSVAYRLYERSVAAIFRCWEPAARTSCSDRATEQRFLVPDGARARLR